MALALLVLALGFLGGVASGVLGVGGGIVMAPALLYVPRLLGAGAFGMKEVTGLTITQGLLACLSGSLGHVRHGCVSRRLVTAMGPAIFAGALAGSLASSRFDGRVLMFLLAGLAAGAAALMWLPKRDEDGAPLNVELAVLVAVVVGLLGGMVGQGGSFLLVPLMLHVLRVPTRVVIGSNLALVLLSSAAGLVGKLATAQVPLLAAAMLALGTLPGAQIGSALSQRTPARGLRAALGVVVGLSAIMLAADALHSH